VRRKNTVSQYGRADVQRILRVTNRQMQTWEKAGLLAGSESYSFFDLLQIKQLRDLTAKRVRSATILKSLQQMRLASGMDNPLLESSVFSTGKRVAFRHEGAAVEPIAGQFVMDFKNREQVMLPSNVRTMKSAETLPELFARGVALEEDPETQPEAIACYMKVLEIDAQHAAAHINLGTIFYNRHDFMKAEKHYRAAITADPRYALAYFDLGNVLDETGRLPDAIKAYLTAIMLAPTYADAHYNVALALEKSKLPRKALLHWRAYVKLDKAGPWSVHAKAQIARILKQESLSLVRKSR
jgi:tetratricopeptide (TPR) repeat protein